MTRRLTMLLAVLIVGVFASTASAAPTVSSCSDWGFQSAAQQSVHQIQNGLDFMELKSYRAAEAWSLKSWQTMKGTSPCRATYKRFRQDELNSSAAIWNATQALRHHDLDQAESLMRKSGVWMDRAAAEQATWG
jgi:hypothetical protein